MKRSENGMVIPFEKFAWNKDKSKLSIKLPLKAIENPLLLFVEFGDHSNDFILERIRRFGRLQKTPTSYRNTKVRF